MGAKIIDRGRGPEIEGTRITIYDIMDYVRDDWRPEQIAGLFRLPLEDIQAALRYIEDHADEVVFDYRRILSRHREARYAPEVQEKIAMNRKKLQNRLAAIRAEQLGEDTHAGAPC